MNKLEQLGHLLAQVTQTEQEVALREDALADAKKRLDTLLSEDIPAVMDSIGVDKLTTTDGWEVRIADMYHASIKEAQREAAFYWLRNNGFGDLIKNQVVTTFDSGEDDLAQKVVHDLTAQGFDATVKEGVHPTTLKSFVKEQKEAGTDIPDDVFGIYHKREAKLKRKNAQ